MNITGETMIFKNEKGYSTTISKKNFDNTYEKMYIAVNFKRDIELENLTKIDIKKAFLSFYKTKNGFTKPLIFVLEFEILNI